MGYLAHAKQVLSFLVFHQAATLLMSVEITLDMAYCMASITKHSCHCFIIVALSVVTCASALFKFHHGAVVWYNSPALLDSSC
eukprot:1140171-Pelagomonas_calceolata.AAC.2